MLTLRPADMEIVQSMKEPLTFRRADQIIEYDPSMPESYTELATGIEAALIPSERPQTVLATGEVINEPDFQCVLLEPLVNISVGADTTELIEGDFVITSDGERLAIDSIFHPRNTMVMVLGLQRLT